jgi:hypothetical protein
VKLLEAIDFMFDRPFLLVGVYGSELVRKMRREQNERVKEENFSFVGLTNDCFSFARLVITL